MVQIDARKARLACFWVMNFHRRSYDLCRCHSLEQHSLTSLQIVLPLVIHNVEMQNALAREHCALILFFEDLVLTLYKNVLRWSSCFVTPGYVIMCVIYLVCHPAIPSNLPKFWVEKLMFCHFLGFCFFNLLSPETQAVRWLSSTTAAKIIARLTLYKISILEQSDCKTTRKSLHKTRSLACCLAKGRHQWQQHYKESPLVE